MPYQNILSVFLIFYQSGVMDGSQSDSILRNSGRLIMRTTSQRSTSDNLQVQNTPRKLIGGNHCGVECYPFMVSLRRSRKLSHFCSGTLLRSDLVLTAAHCIAAHINEPNLFSVIAGLSDTQQLGEQRMAVKKIFIHPYYDEDTFDWDIAVIFLEHRFLITDVVQPIEIPNQVVNDEIAEICPEATVIGWGWQNKYKNRHEETGFIPHVLVMQCVFGLTVLRSARCTTAVRDGVHLIPNRLCAIGTTLGNLCQGDSGGPILCNNVLIGVVSSGYSCNQAEGRPGYYTRIDRVLNFLKDCLTGDVKYDKSIGLAYEEFEDDGVLMIKQNLLCTYFFTIFSFMLRLSII